jgi:hypothetical protein
LIRANIIVAREPRIARALEEGRRKKEGGEGRAEDRCD